jgi:hypothetical protein
MKKRLFLLIAITTNFAFAQQKEISYDFITKKLTLPIEKINDKEDIHISIKNFNPFLYTYSIKTKTVTYNSEVPKLLKNEAGNLMSLDELLAILEKLKKVDRSTANSDATTDEGQVLKTLYKIDTSLLKFYNPNYRFNKKDVIPEKLLKELLDNISKLVSETSKEEFTLYYSKYVSYLRFNAFFDEKLFNKKIEVYSPDADILDITFSFSPITTNESILSGLLSKDSIIVSLPILRKKGYLTYSTGLFISRLGNPSYVIQNKKIIEEEGSTNAFGFNALAHYLWDLQKNTAIGFHLGLGTPFLKNNLSIAGITGLTIAFGKKNRFLINTGPTFGMIKAISSANYKDEKQVTLIDDLKDVKTYQKLKTNWSFSITYNLNK